MPLTIGRTKTLSGIFRDKLFAASITNSGRGIKERVMIFVRTISGTKSLIAKNRNKLLAAMLTDFRSKGAAIIGATLSGTEFLIVVKRGKFSSADRTSSFFVMNRL